MSAGDKNTIYLPTDGTETAVDANDIEMVNASDSSGAKTIEHIEMKKDGDIQPSDENAKIIDEKMETKKENVNMTDATSNASCKPVLGPIDTKPTRNVQTQHGDYRSVDEENTFLIARCLWPEEEKKKYTLLPSTSSDNADSKAVKEEEEEQVVWIEPFANESI